MLKNKAIKTFLNCLSSIQKVFEKPCSFFKIIKCIKIIMQIFFMNLKLLFKNM